MVAKGFLAAAAIIICCGTTLQGKDPEGKCASGDCPAACCDKEQCSIEAKCDDTEECCEKEKSSIEKVSVEKCSTAGECADGRCAGEQCAVMACAGEACATLECAVERCAKLACVAGECAKTECAKTECVKSECAAEKCATCLCDKEKCGAGECPLAACSTEVCASLKCAVEACLTAVNATDDCGEMTCSTEKCGTEKCATSKCAKATTAKCAKETCATSACSTGKCAKSACGDENRAAGGIELEAKLAEINRLQRDVAELRRSADTPETYVVDVKVVEVNRSKCRNLSFDFEVAHGCAANAFAKQTCESLEKNNLAKVLFNPTLCVTSDRPASFAAGVEIPSENGDGEAVSEFIGKKLDVVASSLGGDKVRLQIAPMISEICSWDQEPRRTKIFKCDCVLEATLGKSIVMKGVTEHRVRSTFVEGHAPVEEVEEIQTMLLITVDRAQKLEPPVAVRQAAYEKALVEAVKEPEFITKVYPVPDLQVWRVRPEGAEFDASLLVAHIKTSIAPLSWRGVYCTYAGGNDGEIKPFERNGSLVISQTEENHEQIAELLREMRVAGEQEKTARKVEEAREAAKRDAKVEAAGVELELVRKLIVRPTSAEEPIKNLDKCGKKCGAGSCKESKCSESKCSDAKCSKSQQSAGNSLEFGSRSVDLPLAAGEAPAEFRWDARIDVGFLSEGVEGHGADGHEGACPCIGGTCTR